ncbi:MAG: hypothetical protein PVG39_07540 [Desulfobacteraceae bacterium]|jgi:hypothetical protein
MEEEKGEWSEDNLEGIELDDYMPIYNYAYPLHLSALEEDKIIRICQETNCTVVKNTEDDKLYLALCGCGMDMSQDIALAYMIANAYGDKKYGRIPDHMLFEVYKSGALSVSFEKFKYIRKALIEGFESLKRSCEIEIERLKKTTSKE